MKIINFKYDAIPLNEEEQKTKDVCDNKFPNGITIVIDDDKQTISVKGKTLPVINEKGIALGWGDSTCIKADLRNKKPSEILSEYFEDFTWLDYGLLIVTHVLEYGK